MKTHEFKLKVVKGLNDLIDVYFGSKNLNERFINATLKFLVKQNSNKYDNILSMFSDENGEIDIYTMTDYYVEVIGDEGIKFDLKKYITNDTIRSIIPDKVLVLKKEDIMNLAL